MLPSEAAPLAARCISLGGKTALYLPAPFEQLVLEVVEILLAERGLCGVRAAPGRSLGAG